VKADSPRPPETPARDPEELLEFLSRHGERVDRRAPSASLLGRHGSKIAVLAGVVTALLLVAVNVLIWGNYIHVKALGGSSPDLNSRATVPAAASKPPDLPRARAAQNGEPNDHLPTPQRGASIAIRLTAVRGDCWLEVRAGGPAGRMLYARTLHEGESARIRGRRLWARFGSFANLDVVVNGRTIRSGLTGTLHAYLTPTGIRPTPPTEGGL
jgi:hypothetical protein